MAFEIVIREEGGSISRISLSKTQGDLIYSGGGMKNFPKTVASNVDELQGVGRNYIIETTGPDIMPTGNWGPGGNAY
jgi:hypothetical protein